jgi:integration host factor subunit beta
MTKAQIIERVSEQVTTLTKRQAEIVVNTIFDCIRDSLRKRQQDGDPRVREFSSPRPADEGRSESKNRCDRCGAGQACAILQGRQGTEGITQ